MIELISQLQRKQNELFFITCVFICNSLSKMSSFTNTFDKNHILLHVLEQTDPNTGDRNLNKSIFKIRACKTKPNLNKGSNKTELKHTTAILTELTRRCAGGETQQKVMR